MEKFDRRFRRLDSVGRLLVHEKVHEALLFRFGKVPDPFNSVS
ncbi:hypothetical protein ACFUNF_04100 [Streptomyces sp. NPDC057291]